ncbi:MAG: enoyl-CoA hydratase/isomerase family protein [Deltaproteobacteria bacterium]|nr:enoyl-CoA hydratase/isomerase family protein [Candidatus Zymogenaceae bacterium]
MEYRLLDLEQEERTAIVRISRPEKKNALSIDLIEELSFMAEDLKKRADLIAVILTGGDSYFSPGVDLSDPKLYEIFGEGLFQKRKAMEYGPRMCRAWEDLDQFTIAAIEGFCVGGGVALTASLDFRVMAESSFIRVPEIGLGMNMSWASLPRLVHLVGPARAKEIVIFAERVKAADAYEWGFAQRITADGNALSVSRKIAEHVAEKPPVQVAMTKQTINALTTALDRLTSHMDTDQFILSLMSEDFKEGVAAYQQKRKPSFTGR